MLTGSGSLHILECFFSGTPSMPVVESNRPPFFPPIFQKELKSCYSLRERNADLEAK
jgi:hypothetical protein